MTLENKSIIIDYENNNNTSKPLAEIVNNLYASKDNREKEKRLVFTRLY